MDLVRERVRWNLSLRSVVNGLEFGCVLGRLRDARTCRVPTGWAVPGGSADGEDRLGCWDAELFEDLGELGSHPRGLNDGLALARVADRLEPLEKAGELAPGKSGRDLGSTLDHQ